MTNDEKVFEMVERSPGIRVMQVADQLGVDNDVAEELLKNLVLGNRITCDLGPVIGGGRVRAYTAPVRGNKPTPTIQAPAPASKPAASPEKEPESSAPGPTKPARRPYTRSAKQDVNGEKSNIQIALPPTASFRVGMWSDGMLEVQRDGQTIARFNRDEQKQLQELLAGRFA